MFFNFLGHKPRWGLGFQKSKIMLSAFYRLAQKADAPVTVANDEILSGMAVFLARIVGFLLILVFTNLHTIPS